MEIDQFLVNSKGEAFNLDEFSDLEPVLVEIFSSDISQCNLIDALNFQQASKKVKLNICIVIAGGVLTLLAPNFKKFASSLLFLLLLLFLPPPN